MSKIFRNSARQNKEHFHSYTPEYVRLGVSPMEFGGVQKDFPTPRKIHKQSSETSATFSIEDDSSLSEEIEADELPQVPPQIYSYPDELAQGLTNNQPDLSSEEFTSPEESRTEFSPGDFAILLNGEICFVSSSIEEVESWVEFAIFKENVNIADLMVIKRIPLKIGVVASL